MGGPFTRYDPSDENDDNKKSALGLVIVSTELVKYVEKLEIDSKKLFTPFRPLSKNKLRYTDHYSLFLIFRGLPMKIKSPSRKVTVWNLNKEGGWNRYKELSDDNKTLREIVENNENDGNAMMEKLEKVQTKMKFQAFGKIQIDKNSEVDKEIDKVLDKKKVAVHKGAH